MKSKWMLTAEQLAPLLPLPSISEMVRVYWKEERRANGKVNIHFMALYNSMVDSLKNNGHDPKKWKKKPKKKEIRKANRKRGGAKRTSYLKTVWHGWVHDANTPEYRGVYGKQVVERDE